MKIIVKIASLFFNFLEKILITKEVTINKSLISEEKEKIKKI
jgi:hypothetical protein